MFYQGIPFSTQNSVIFDELKDFEFKIWFDEMRSSFIGINKLIYPRLVLLFYKHLVFHDSGSDPIGIHIDIPSDLGIVVPPLSSDDLYVCRGQLSTQVDVCFIYIDQWFNAMQTQFTKMINHFNQQLATFLHIMCQQFPHLPPPLLL